MSIEKSLCFDGASWRVQLLTSYHWRVYAPGRGEPEFFGHLERKRDSDGRVFWLPVPSKSSIAIPSRLKPELFGCLVQLQKQEETNHGDQKE
jgi:hypothetical protein